MTMEIKRTGRKSTLIIPYSSAFRAKTLVRVRFNWTFDFRIGQKNTLLLSALHLDFKVVRRDRYNAASRSKTSQPTSLA